jgi:HlyD family secretion protein
MSTLSLSSKSRLPFLRKHPRWAILALLLVLLLVAGGWVYSVQARKAAATGANTLPQTATVRQGNLVVSASGTGALAAADEIDLAFTTSGQVTGVFAKPGDQVQAGALLAQVDSQEAQAQYAQAQQAYRELTSAAAIASAQAALAQAQADLMSAKYQLEYLISPKVMYWEAQVAQGQAALEAAEATAKVSPADQNAAQALKKARDFLAFARDSLAGAWQSYYDEYVPETFPLLEDRNDKDVYNVPTASEIRLARTAIDEAQKKVTDSQQYYDALAGGSMPEDASSDALVKLQQAERDLQDAKAVLDGTKITAPIDGTVLTVDTAAGDIASTSTVITMADLSQLRLDFFLDATDWNLAAVGNQAEITFDALPDQTFTGKVTQLDAELYQSGNSSEVQGIVQLDSTASELDLPIGASASVEIIHAQAENVPLVPVEALHETAPGKYTVYVVKNGALAQRDVEIGLQDEVYAEVKAGLQAGEVVSTGSANTGSPQAQ